MLGRRADTPWQLDLNGIERRPREHHPCRNGGEGNAGGWNWCCWIAA